MHLAVLTVEIHIPSSLSLKDKRMVVRSIRDRIRKKFNVSVSELEYQDKWQRSVIAFAAVASSRSHLDETMQKIFHNLDQDFQFEIIKHSFEYR
jgi:hypothetical protein